MADNPFEIGAEPVYITDGRNYVRLDDLTATLIGIDYAH